MAKQKRPDRPKSRLPDGRVNPEYTKWRKENITGKPKLTDAFVAAVVAEVMTDKPPEIRPATEEERTKLVDWIKGDEPETLTLRVEKLANNNRFVLCADPENKGKTVPVRLLRAGTGRKALRKPIKAVMRDGKLYQVK